MQTFAQRLVPLVSLILVLGAEAMVPAQEPGVDPLPSWNQSAARTAILEFVSRTTQQNEAGFVPPAKRIAVSDNDGTLWCEQPMYVQLALMFGDRAL